MTVAGFLFYLVGSYFLFSVWSLYIAIKRKNRNADIIVQSVSQGEWLPRLTGHIMPSVTFFIIYFSRPFERTRYQ